MQQGFASCFFFFFLGLCKFSFLFFSPQDFTALKVKKREAAVPTPQQHKHLEPSNAPERNQWDSSEGALGLLPKRRQQRASNGASYPGDLGALQPFRKACVTDRYPGTRKGEKHLPGQEGGCVTATNSAPASRDPKMR